MRFVQNSKMPTYFVFSNFLKKNLEIGAKYVLWHSRLWSFKTRDTKLERFLHKNQHTQRNLLNFENWTNGEPQNLQKSEFLKLIILAFLSKKLKN